MALSVGVELSYLDEQFQCEILNACERYDCTPSYAQANRMHKLCNDGKLSVESIYGILSEEKANQRETVKIPMDKLRGKLPENCTAQEQEAFILKAIDYYQRYLHRQRDRER